MSPVGRRARRLGVPVAGIVALVVALVAAVALTQGAASAAASGVGTRADDGASVWSETWLGPREVDVSVFSPAINNFATVRLLLPPGWSATSTQTWPVLYLLHGGNDTYVSWTRETDIAARTVNTPAIIAMPDAGYNATYTNYYNGGKGGPPAWETFHVTEVWQLLQRGYHAGAVRSVAGISSGGYGAMIYAAHNPGQFKFAASYSGPVYIDMPGTQVASTLIVGDKDPNARWGAPVVNAAQWHRWDPYYQATSLRGTGLYLSSGLTGLPGAYERPSVGWSPAQFGEAFVGQMNMALSLRLRLLGVPVTTDLYELGTHSWGYWQHELDLSWSKLMGSLGITA
jgi:S-formylglutathione hydrolase FrmB